MSEENGSQKDLKVYSQEVYENPYPTYGEMRRKCPVYHDTETGDYLISRYKEVFDGLLDAETFSNAGYLDDGYYRDQGLIIAGQDEPRHSELRNPLAPVFRRDNMERIAPRIAAIVAELVAKLQPNEVIEVAEQYALPLPGRSMAELIGYPQEDYALVAGIAFSIVGWWRGMDPEGSDKFDAYFKPIVEGRRRAPKDDVISVLLASDAYSEADLLRAVYFLVLAGTETTRDCITVLTKELAERPQLWTQLRADRSLVASAVEEAVRVGSPSQRIRKRATRDVDVAGVTIPKDARVQFVLAAASHDDEVFPEADDFQLGRRTKLGDIRHVSFGKGVHACLGAPLARLEMRLLLNALLERFEKIELVEVGGVGNAKTTRGYEHLKVRFG